MHRTIVVNALCFDACNLFPRIMAAARQLSSNASCKKLTWVHRLHSTTSLEGHEGCVNTLHWSSDGQHLVSGSDDRHVHLWHCNGADASSMAGKAPCSIETLHRDNISDAQFERCNTRIVSCGADGCISRTGLVHQYNQMLYDQQKNDQQSVPSAASKLAFTGSQVFQVAFRDGRVRQFDLRESGHRVAVDTNGVALMDIERQPMGPLLAVGGGDPFLRIYDLRMLSYHRERLASANDRPTQTMSMHIMPKLLSHLHHVWPPSRALSRSPRLAWQAGSTQTNPFEHAAPSVASFTSSRFGRTSVRSSRLFSPVTRIGISGVRWNKSGDLLLVNYRGSDVALFDMANSSLGGTVKIPSALRLPSDRVQLNVLRSFEGRSNVMSFTKEVCFLGGNAAVATGGDCGGLFIWETATGALLQRHAADARIVNCVAPHPKLHVVCTSGVANEIEVWGAPQNHNAEVSEVSLQHKRLSRSSSAGVVGRDSGAVPKIGPWSLGSRADSMERGLLRSASQPRLFRLRHVT